MNCDEIPLQRRARESMARRKRHEGCVWMARKMTGWPSKRGPITKIMPSDGSRRSSSSLGGGNVVRFPRIWMATGECVLKILR